MDMGRVNNNRSRVAKRTTTTKQEHTLSLHYIMGMARSGLVKFIAKDDRNLILSCPVILSSFHNFSSALYSTGMVEKWKVIFQRKQPRL